MPLELSIAILGFFMGVVTSISGGAGVFAVPMMIAMGMPPITSLALNKMSDLGVVTGALRNYNKSKAIDWKLGLQAMIPMGLGAFAGANILLHLPADILKIVIIVGVFIGIFFLLKPVHKQDGRPASAQFLGMPMLFLCGAWSGGIGMAGVAFVVLVLVHFFNKTFLEARSTEVVAAIPETVIGVIVLSLGSTASLMMLLTMYISSFIGAWVGAHIAVKHGDQFIRKAMIVVAVLMVIKVVIDL